MGTGILVLTQSRTEFDWQQHEGKKWSSERMTFGELLTITGSEVHGALRCLVTVSTQRCNVYGSGQCNSVNDIQQLRRIWLESFQSVKTTRKKSNYLVVLGLIFCIRRCGRDLSCHTWNTGSFYWFSVIMSTGCWPSLEGEPLIKPLRSDIKVAPGTCLFKPLLHLEVSQSHGLQSNSTQTWCLSAAWLRPSPLAPRHRGQQYFTVLSKF